MPSDQKKNSVLETKNQFIEDTVAPERRKHNKRHFGKKGTLIFLTGFFFGAILLAAFSFAGFGGYFNGTVASTGQSQNETFEKQVLNAELPVVLLVSDGGNDSLSQDFTNTFTDLKKKYASQLDFVQMNYTDNQAFFTDLDIVTQPSLVLYENKEAKGVITTRGTDFVSLLTNQYPNLVDETTNPAVYTMFYKNAAVDLPQGYEEYDAVGEIRLFAYTPSLDAYQICKGQTLSGYRYRTLAALYGSTTDNQVTATLPDLSGSAPLSGIEYYMCTNYGLAAETTSTTGTVVGNIKYYQHKNMKVTGFYIGEVRLVEGGTNSAYSGNLLPCNGAELKIDDYPKLYEKIGTTYGGDGKTTFCVPDFKGKSPISGAQYYICFDGTPAVVQ